MKIAFSAYSAKSPAATAAKKRLVELYGDTPLDQADALVCLGGDGCMLKTLHHLPRPIPVYGINYGSSGFLMNERSEYPLWERIRGAHAVSVSPLKMRVRTTDGAAHEAVGFNDVYISRQTAQTVHVRIEVDGHTRLKQLVSDGVIVATPMGSTAYNRSVQGPIMPLDANLLSMVPISPTRPHHWRGALVPMTSKIKFHMEHTEKRPATAVADWREIRNVAEVEIEVDHSIKYELLFDAARSLPERIMRAQFMS